MSTSRIAAATLPRLQLAGLLAAGAAVGLISGVSPHVALAVVGGVAFVAITFTDLTLGLVLFTLLTFFSQISRFAGAGVTVVKVAGAVLAIAWLFRALAPERRLPLLTRSHPLLSYLVAILVGWSALSFIWAASLHVAISSAFRLVQSLILFFIIFSGVSTRRHVRWLLWAFIAGAVASAVIGIGGATSAESFGPYANQRLTGGIGDPNELASVLVPAVVFAAFGFAATRSIAARWLLLASSAVCVFALFRTESRGGIVALGAAGLATLLFSGRWRLRALASIGLAGALSLVYFTFFASSQAVARITDFHAAGGTGRQDVWTLATRMIRDHPVRGVGIGNFPVVEPTYALQNVDVSQSYFVVGQIPKATHNTYLQILAELGVVGFVAFALIILAALGLGVRAVRSAAQEGDSELELLARGLVIGAIGMLAAFFFISAQYEKQLPIVLGLLTTLATIPPTRMRLPLRR
jgi:O-antigen ligase